MTPLFAIAAREFAGMFRTPAGWVTTALYTLLTGTVFALTALVPGEPATMRYFFSPATFLLLTVCPAVSMRTFSEEFRARTVELLVTSPIGEVTVVLGKFLGAVAFLAAMLAPTLVFPFVLWVASDPAPDPGPVVGGYLGLMLAGSAYLAIGTLVSALTDNQTLSFLATLIVLLMLLLGTGLVAQHAPPWLGSRLAALSILARVNDFSRGVILTGHLAFFAAVIAPPLAATVLVIAARRRR